MNIILDGESVFVSEIEYQLNGRTFAVLDNRRIQIEIISFRGNEMVARTIPGDEIHSSALDTIRKAL